MTNQPLSIALALVLGAAPLGAQAGAGQWSPRGYGTLKQDDIALRVRNDDLEVRFIPLDHRVLPLLAPDAYESLRGVVVGRRHAIDSVAAQAGVSQPGLALVSFFAQRPGVRFDPQTLTVSVRNRVFQPLGIVPLSPQFTSQQLDVRGQASAIYLYEEELPVNDSFTMSYAGLTSEDWSSRIPLLDRERARVSARARTAQPDTAKP